jgi:hypothetical protein
MINITTNVILKLFNDHIKEFLKNEGFTYEKEGLLARKRDNVFFGFEPYGIKWPPSTASLAVSCRAYHDPYSDWHLETQPPRKYYRGKAPPSVRRPIWGGDMGLMLQRSALSRLYTSDEPALDFANPSNSLADIVTLFCSDIRTCIDIVGDKLTTLEGIYLHAKETEVNTKIKPALWGINNGPKLYIEWYESQSLHNVK